jgi:hypothetical protein
MPELEPHYGKWTRNVKQLKKNTDNCIYSCGQKRRVPDDLVTTFERVTSRIVFGRLRCKFGAIWAEGNYRKRASRLMPNFRVLLPRGAYFSLAIGHAEQTMCCKLRNFRNCDASVGSKCQPQQQVCVLYVSAHRVRRLWPVQVWNRASSCAKTRQLAGDALDERENFFVYFSSMLEESVFTLLGRK